jgi:hypothetical protein
MSDLYNQIVSGRNGFEQLLAKLPGFKGYHDREARRQADKMLRDFLAEQIATQINRFSAAERDLLDADGGLMFMAKTSAAKSRMQTLHDKIKAAPQGFSGFFGAIKIESEELEKLYNFDEAMVRYADELKTAVEALAAAVGDKDKTTDAIKAVERIASEGSEAYDLRDDVLTNLDKMLGH